MDNRELIDSAATKVGGISELARQLTWDKGSIAAVKAGKRALSPYRAAQIAKVLGRDETSAYLAALATQAEGEEQKFWLSELKKRSKSLAIIGALAILLSFSSFPRAEAAQPLHAHEYARYTLCVL